MGKVLGKVHAGQAPAQFSRVRCWWRYPRDVRQRGQRVEAEAAAHELGGADEERGNHTDAGQELRGGHRSVSACPPSPSPVLFGVSRQLMPAAQLQQGH